MIQLFFSLRRARPHFEFFRQPRDPLLPAPSPPTSPAILPDSFRSCSANFGLASQQPEERVPQLFQILLNFHKTLYLGYAHPLPRASPPPSPLLFFSATSQIHRKDSTCSFLSRTFLPPKEKRFFTIFSFFSLYALDLPFFADELYLFTQTGLMYPNWPHLRVHSQLFSLSLLSLYIA